MTNIIFVSCRTAGSPGRSAPAAWQHVADHLILLFNSTTNRHVQFQQFTASLAPSHYVCPEDVLYLTWPMGPYLNLSREVMQNDALFYTPLTCLENAGSVATDKRKREKEKENKKRVKPKNMKREGERNRQS